MSLVIRIRLKHDLYGVGYWLVFYITLHVAGNWDTVQIWLLFSVLHYSSCCW